MIFLRNGVKFACDNASRFIWNFIKAATFRLVTAVLLGLGLGIFLLLQYGGN